MLRQSSSKKGGHVVWDEENLKVNAEIQKEYSGIKVDEPKTPYHRALSADDELHFDEDMKPLDLDEERTGGAPSAADDAATAKAAVEKAYEYALSNGGADDAGTSAAFSPTGTSHLRIVVSSDAADGAQEAGVSGCSDDGGELSADKKRRFAEMRKQHYNMKEALRQARQLLASEDGEEHASDDDDDDDDDEDLQDSPAAQYQRTAASSAAEPAANGHHSLNSSQQQQQQEQQQDGITDEPHDMDGS